MCHFKEHIGFQVRHVEIKIKLVFTKKIEKVLREKLI